MKTITLHDVARVAGVSYQTVSRMINQAAHVSPRTREKAQVAMQELHYVPNRGAQQLAGKATRALGLLTTDLALHTLYICPTENGLRCETRQLEYGAHCWRGEFHFGLSRYSQRQLHEATHHHLLREEPGC
ncbi:LacI family DNA-binding transcriptional regulator [Kluyvera sp. 142486]|uniref:LacI family DNA-binding transcriptional regulator n=1 Tax=Kluyvera sp. 142486 TaxID=3390050 RepID=UPI00398113C4